MSFSTQYLSIKLKLIIALIATGLSLVMIYIFIAKTVFEKDKISYVFDSQRSRVSTLNRDIESRLNRVLFSSRSLLATLDHSGKISQPAKDLFQELQPLLAIQIWDELAKKSSFVLEKKTGLFQALGPVTEKVPFDSIKISPTNDQKFIFLFRPNKSNGNSLIIRIVMDAHDLLPENEIMQPTMLVKDGRVISAVGSASFEKDLLNSLAEDFGKDDKNLTTIWKYGSKKFLVSGATLAVGKIKTLAFISETEALGALNTLYSRSMVFLAFSVFGLIAISMFLSATLTANLNTLTQAATEIGRGNFDEIPAIKAQDEMGVLSKAFHKMSEEIQRLLAETKDKARMEAELKTAKLVQESLLPAEDTVVFNDLEISGVSISSTECGGDWWYYFTRGDEVYIAIADATGHGTPAALITAAARSVFSRIENEDLSIAEMMRAWDFAISSCSKRRVYMTGMIFKINSKTGVGSFVSAGHESPFLFEQVDEGYENSMLDLDINPVLGEGIGDIKEQEFELKLGASLVLYTDGLFSVELPDGKKLSEKRLGKSISGKIEFSPSARQVKILVLEAFENHRMGAPLPDDVTIVSLHRKGPVRDVLLEDDSGTLLYKETAKSM